MTKERDEQPREGSGEVERSGTEPDPSVRRGQPGRRSAEDKASAVKELLLGRATVDQLALRFGVRPAVIEKWREEALSAIDAAFRSGPGPEERALQKEYQALQKAFTDLAIRHELAARYIKSHPRGPRRS